MLIGGGLFFILSVAGSFWPKPTPMNDLGLYSVTVILVGFGVSGLLLRSAKMNPPARE